MIYYTHEIKNYLMPHVAQDVAQVWHSRPRGEIGIRTRLKILGFYKRVGSSPTEATMLKTISTSLKILCGCSYTLVSRQKSQKNLIETCGVTCGTNFIHYRSKMHFYAPKNVHLRHFLRH